MAEEGASLWRSGPQRKGHRYCNDAASMGLTVADDCLSVRGGVLFIEGCDAPSLAERFGTPLYVMSEDQLRRNVRAFQSEFQHGWPDGRVVVMPSIKANYVLALRRILTEEGAGCDTFGPGELHAAPRSMPAVGSPCRATRLREAIRAAARQEPHRPSRN